MWIVFIVFKVLNIDMGIMGIKPVSISGLTGILTSPFAHAGIKHIIANSMSFAVLSALLFYFYRGVAYKIFFINWLISGVLLWLGGRDSIHIGASGLIYGLAFFLIFSGIFRKEKKYRAISLIVVFLYGGMFWGMLPQNGHISWEGHLFGAMSGLFLAWYFKNFTPVNNIIDTNSKEYSITGDYSINYEYIE
jgi:membrane associated rhomboid family serine protease